MGIRPEDFPYCPHSVTWRPKGDVPRSTGGFPQTFTPTNPPPASGGAANDGKDDSATSVGGYGDDFDLVNPPPPETIGRKDLTMYVEPKSAFWAAQRYGVETERQFYLLIGRVSEMKNMEKGDLIDFGDRTLTLESRPLIYPPVKGFEHGEVVAVDKSSGAR